MHISTELHDTQFEEVFENLERNLDKRLWEKRSSAVALQIRQCPFLKAYLVGENQVALALARLSALKKKTGRLPLIRVDSIATYEAVAFASQIQALLESADAAFARSVLGRARGCFKNPDDMRGFLLELLAATHLSRRGARLAVPDSPGEGTYDWLATIDDLEFEIECKSISPNKGRKVHREQALRMHHLVACELGSMVDRLIGGLLVRIVVPDRFPTNFSDTREIAKQVKSSVLSARQMETALAEVSMAEFSLADTPFASGKPEPMAIQQFLHDRFGITNREAMAYGSPGKCAFVLVVQSREPDRLLEETMSTLEDAARRQLTGRRPAVLCAKFEGLNSDELTDLGREKATPSALRIHASGFLDKPRHAHVASLAFLADGELTRSEGEAISRTGAVYYFTNANSPYGGENRLKIFASPTR
jgi:hypothetical protein